MSPSKPKPTMSKNRRPAASPTSTRTGVPQAIVLASSSGSPAQAEMLGDQIFRTGRQDGEGNARLLIEQVRDGPVTPHGHQAAAPRIARRPLHQARSFLRRPGDLLAKSHSPECFGQPTRQDASLYPYRSYDLRPRQPNPTRRRLGLLRSLLGQESGWFGERLRSVRTADQLSLVTRARSPRQRKGGRRRFLREDRSSRPNP